MSATSDVGRQAQRGFLVEEAERAGACARSRPGGGPPARGSGTVEHAPRQAEERLHERRVLVVVAEAAVDGGAREATSAGGRASVLSTRSPYQRPVELGGVEVVAFVARVALGLAAGDERDERDDEDDDGDALVGARGHANHRRASAWKPKLRQAGLAALTSKRDAVARAGERARVDVEAAPAVVVADVRAQLLDAVDVDDEVDEAVGRSCARSSRAGRRRRRACRRAAPRCSRASSARAIGGHEQAAARAVVDLEGAALDALAAAEPAAACGSPKHG